MDHNDTRPSRHTADAGIFASIDQRWTCATQRAYISTRHRDDEGALGRLSASKLQLFVDKVCALAESSSNRINRINQLTDPCPAPRYDDVYYDGLEWLDNL